jgi:hypothetical protein
LLDLAKNLREVRLRSVHVVLLGHNSTIGGLT